MNFKLDILVNSEIPFVFKWEAKELNDLAVLENRFLAELEVVNPGFFDDWKVIEDEDGFFWAKSPIDILHAKKGKWGGDWFNPEIFADQIKMNRIAIRRWLQASQIILIGLEREFNRNQISVVLYFAFKGDNSKDPVKFAREVDYDHLIEYFWKWFAEVEYE